MSKSYRIRTTPGKDNGYLKVDVDLNQNYDFLELLSLKISQKEDYQDFCADYGVVAGRVIVNGGFGVPNVKVSVFVPVSDADLENPVISEIYNYTEPFSDQKNGNGIRYNLLPKNQQTLEHTPVGTFPKKREILDDGTTLEIYEKYYKYTTTTNEAGDYIIFGVPVGEQFLHYDMDVSDIGFISTRPFELINRGYSDDLFDSRYKYESSEDLDSLPQIFSENIPITVEPYWCDSLSTGSALGINRLDIEPNIEIIPTSVFMGSVFSDDEKDSINKNCKPDRQMGKMNEVITSSGKIEAIRRTVEGSIEKYELKEESIDENGNWSVLIPMNLRKVVTDEFGNLVPSPDGVKGIATEGDYRFRLSMDATSNDKRLRQRAKFLVPNTNNNFVFREYSQTELKNSTDFTLNEELSNITDSTPFENDITNQYNYLEEFFPFRWKKIYTVKQYIGRFQRTGNDEARGFIGVKDILNSEGVNKFPSNRHDSNFNILYTIICLILSIFATVIGIVNGIINIINGLITFLCQIKLPFSVCVFSSGDDNGSKYKLDYKRQVRALGLWVNDNPNPAFELQYTPTYAPLPDFTGTDNSKNPGDWGTNGYSLDPCNGAFGGLFEGPRYWYPATQTEDPDVPGQFTEIPLLPQSEQQQNNPPYVSNLLLYPSLRWSDLIDSSGNRKDWVYLNIFNQIDSSCEDNPVNGCKRVKLSDSGNWRESIISCDKDNINDPPEPCGVKFLGIRLCLKYKCLFGAVFCKKCRASCPNSSNGNFNTEPHSCCGDAAGGGAYGCPENPAVCGGGFFGECCGDCCVKIPLIPLRCSETGETWNITLIPTPFAAQLCNSVYVVPGTCVTCGGLQTPGIKDWLSCILEDLAVFLNMLKFDFYNDWVGGSLYFPLVKRKYKLKKRKRKFGQIKKDKFCDFDCDDFQEPGPTQYKIFVVPSTNPDNNTITVEGCSANIKSPIATGWYGSEEIQNTTDILNLAVKDLVFEGLTNTLNQCQIKFDTYADLQSVIPVGSFPSPSGPILLIRSKTLPGEHGKPEYIESEDPTGFSTWENVGGHGHHRNTCDNTRLMERKEYFKRFIDCVTPDITDEEAENVLEDNEVITIDNPESEETVLDDEGNVESEGDLGIGGPFCDSNSCDGRCKSGLKPCVGIPDEYGYYKSIIRHGLITWYEGEIYYTPYIPINDEKENDTEYKANLMLPTTIMELGSMTFCDIDNTPFIINQVPPTTFNVSYENFKAKLGNITAGGPAGSPAGSSTKEIKKLKDDKDSSLNLNAYIEYSCFSNVCVNTPAIGNQSQIGVELVDKNDIGIQTGSCYLRFDHDEELREYFCKRFSGYKSDRTFHHFRPGGTDTDNQYNTYPEISLVDGSNPLYYEFPADNGGQSVLSEYNDSDSFIPGDACGYVNNNSNADYFYGLAPGSTQVFINYPNGDTTGSANGTLDFGNPPITPIVQTVNTISSVVENGIRFNRSQTPYYLYFGIVPGKTAIHKTVGKFFADKINAVTLQGIGQSNGKVSGMINNSPGINDGEENKFAVYRTCLGESLIDTTGTD